ncbi:MAG: hypothetical protein QXR26_07015 [Candidatus Caldarchaeum sp.]
MVLDGSEAASDPTGNLRSKWETSITTLTQRDLEEYVKGYIRMYPTKIRILEVLERVTLFI